MAIATQILQKKFDTSKFKIPKGYKKATSCTIFRPNGGSPQQANTSSKNIAHYFTISFLFVSLSEN